MANPELSQRIQELPEELLGLEREPGIAERLRRIDALKDRARALDPLDGVEDMALADYDRDWLVRYTYNSNAIEGSTLTLEDTSLVLEGEFVPSDSPARYVFAARGVADGMAYVREYAREGRRLDEELVRRVHEVTALDLQPFARGTFRPYGYLARITATRVKTADPLEIRDDLRALIDGLDASGAHPLLRTAGFHAMFENIHPFMDGNGRTGRQLLNFMLLKHGYRPVAIKYDAKRDYARSLETWQVDGDPVRSAPCSSTAWNRRNTRSSIWSRDCVGSRTPFAAKRICWTDSATRCGRTSTGKTGMARASGPIAKALHAIWGADSRMPIGKSYSEPYLSEA